MRKRTAIIAILLSAALLGYVHYLRIPEFHSHIWVPGPPPVEIHCEDGPLVTIPTPEGPLTLHDCTKIMDQAFAQGEGIYELPAAKIAIH